MNRKLRFLGICAAAIVALEGCATRVATDPQSEASKIAAARRLMSDTRYCALITVGEDGRPQARTIDPSPPDERLVVWFVTNPATRKVRQIERDPRVTLYYFDPRSPGYVTLLGTARIIEDPDEKQQRWLGKWTPFYPGGADDALLYEVTPSRIEVLDVARGIVGDPATWTPPAIEFQNRP